MLIIIRANVSLGVVVGVHFVVEVQEVKKNVPVLPEVNHYGHDTRVKMVG